jgi:uncharacterized protein
MHRRPSHRALAVSRGRSLEILDAKLRLGEVLQAGQAGIAGGHLAGLLNWSHQQMASDELNRTCVSWTWKVKLSQSLKRDLFTRLREAAETTAIKVLGDNLRDLLLAAGVLRIPGGDNPLDLCGAQPETYPLVEKIILAAGRPIKELIGAQDVLRRLLPERFTDGRFGPITVRDVLQEMEKPGRDPRPNFKGACFNEGVHDLRDLREDMALECTVSHVAQFGAFVDLGVHRDGLVHVSQLAHHFVQDARGVLKAGDVVRARVLEVDLTRKRSSLWMKPDAAPDRSTGRGSARRFQAAGREERVRSGPTGTTARPASAGRGPAAQGATAAAFAKLQQGR